MEIGTRLRAARLRRGWSLYAAAAASDGRFKPSILGAYERGERQTTVSTLYSLATLYETSVLGLLPLDDHQAGSINLATRLAALPPKWQDTLATVIEQIEADHLMPNTYRPQPGKKAPRKRQDPA